MGTAEPRRSALVLLVPEADPVVGRLRLAYDPVARLGMAAHVTLLFPFVPAERIDADVLARLEDQFAWAPDITGEVELRFERTARFPGVSWLAPSEPERIANKIRALTVAWPDHPPYGGEFDDVVPHLTVAHGDEAIIAAAEAEIAPRLPVVSHARFASLVAEDDVRRWGEIARFALDTRRRRL